MVNQDEKPDLYIICDTLAELKSEVSSLRAEVGRLEGSILKERTKSVEEALAQNRLLLFANQLQDELAEDAENLARSGCKNQVQCIERFSSMINENVKIVKTFMSKEAIQDLDTKIVNMANIIEKAKGTPCEICHQNFQKRLKRQKRAFQTVVLVENTGTQTQNDAAANIDFLVEKLLEPLANSARLTILVSLFEGKKSFSRLSEITNLKGGHLIFHIKKLSEALLIAQENNKGDYIITQRGADAMKKIMALQTT